MMKSDPDLGKRGSQSQNQNQVFGSTTADQSHVFSLEHLSLGLKTSPLRRFLKTEFDTLNVCLKYAMREAWHHKTSYSLGCISVFLVVFLVALFVGILQYGSLVFLLIQEASFGQMDLMLSLGGWTGYDRLNYTQVEAMLPDMVGKMSPRIYANPIPAWSISSCSRIAGISDWSTPNNFNTLYTGNFTGATFTSTSNPTQNSNSILNTCRNGMPRDCVKAICAGQTSAQIYMVAIDTERERAADFGRSYFYPPIPSDGVYIDENLARYIGVNEGDMIIIEFPEWLLSQMFYSATSLIWRNGFSDWPYTGNVLVPLKVYKILKIAEVVPKVGNNQNNVVFVEYSNLAALLGSHMNPRYPDILRQSILRDAGLRIYQYATTIVFGCSSPRTNCYLEQNFSKLLSNLLNWVENIVFKIGYNSVSVNISLISGLRSGVYITAFLNLVLTIVLLLLGSLSAFLVYCLLMVAVETKTFELGIFRMVGMTRRDLIYLILTQAMFYAVPAWIFGLVFAQLALLVMKYVFYNSTQVIIDGTLSSAAIIASSIMGLGTPIVSSIIPIQMALQKNLHEALETRRAKHKAVIINIERSQAGSTFRWSHIQIGGLLAAFGIAIYYLLPLSLLTNNISLLFNIFLVVLLGLLTGLVFLSINMQPLLERILAFFMFEFLHFTLRENLCVRPMVLKNLLLHKMRNRKTALSYAMALGFIMFLNVSITTQLKTLSYQNLQNQGATIKLTLPQWVNGFPNLDVLDSYLESIPDIVESYSLASKSQYETLTNLGRVYSSGVNLFAVTPTFFQTADSDDFLILKQENSVVDLATSPNGNLNSNSYFNLGQALYSAWGTGGMITSINLKDSVGAELGGALIIANSATMMNETTQRNFYARQRSLALASQCPVFGSIKPFPSGSVDSIISLTDMVQLYYGTKYWSVTDVRIERIFIKIVPGVSKSTINSVLNQVNQIINNVAWSSTFESSTSGYSSAFGILNIVFQSTILIAMIVTFFSLNSTMFTNIVEQRQEIGVWRALGLRQATIYRIFAYESFLLVASSSILGMSIGTAMGVSVTAQRSLFTQLPVYFDFPVLLMVEVIAAAFVCSILSTVSPVYQYMRKPLVSLLK